MKEKKEAPAISARANEGVEVECLYKGIGKYPVLQKCVYDLLQRGGKYSAADISKRIGLSDPRGHIRDLRHKGIDIRDEKRKGVNGGIYKVYYIHKED